MGGFETDCTFFKRNILKFIINTSVKNMKADNIRRAGGFYFFSFKISKCRACFGTLIQPTAPGLTNAAGGLVS